MIPKIKNEKISQIRACGGENIKRKRATWQRLRSHQYQAHFFTPQMAATSLSTAAAFPIPIKPSLHQSPFFLRAFISLPPNPMLRTFLSSSSSSSARRFLSHNTSAVINRLYLFPRISSVTLHHQRTINSQRVLAMAEQSSKTIHNHKHTNRLAAEHSPYLLQHAHNPVICCD